MNALCYKVIFSKRLGALVAVGENATSQGKSASGAACRSVVGPTSIGASSAYSDYVGALKSLFIASTLACVTASPSWAAPAANALPTNGVVQTGAATVSTNGTAMTINQSTQRASINWNSFSIGSAASVNVVQNNASSVLLNRVVGNDPSQIFGKLTANGQVILINPNGIVFGKGGSVTASAFTASTFGMTEEDFKKGKYKYSRNGSTAGVTVEEGASINTTVPGGYIALIASTVSNHGNLSTKQGPVIMAAAETVTLPSAMTDSVGIPLSGKVRLELDPSTINASVENGGTITTEGGQVLMQAAAVADAVASITHTGTIDTTGAEGGAVTLQADHGDIKATGTIKANSKNAKNKGGSIIIGRDEVTGILAKTTDVHGAKLESQGGFVETSGDWLATTGARVKAKDWLLDPANITITDTVPSGSTYSDPNGTGGSYPYTATATSNILASDIQASLNDGTNVTISTGLTGSAGADAGNITVASNINKSSDTAATLTLEANNKITFKNGIKISDSGLRNLGVHLIAKGASGNGNSVVMEANSAVDVGGNVVFDVTSKAGNGLNNSAIWMALGSLNQAENNGGSRTLIRGSNVTLNTTLSGNNTWGLFAQHATGIEATTGDVNITTTFTGGASTTSGMATWMGSNWNSPTAPATNYIKATNGSINVESINTGTQADGKFNFAGTTISAKNDISLKAKITNATQNAIVIGNEFSDPKVKSDKGNVLIQSNQGAIGLSSLTAGAISGNNVTIDNTGSTLTRDANGNFTKGAGSFTGTSGASVSMAGSGTGIQAAGSLDVIGVGSVSGSIGVTLTGTSAQGARVSIQGENLGAGGGKTNGFYNTGAITSTVSDVYIRGVSQKDNALSLQGAITAKTDANIVGAAGDAGNTASSWGLYLNKAITAQTGNISVSATSTSNSAASAYFDTGASLTTNATGKVITVKADTLQAQPTTSINAGTSGTVNLRPATDGVSIDLGGNNLMTTGSNVLGLSNALLKTVKAGQLNIGSNKAGDITVSTAVNTLDDTGNVALITGGNIAINNALKVGTNGGKNLSMTAGQAITNGTNGSINAAVLSVKAGTTIGSSLAKLQTKVGSLFMESADNQYVTEADGVTVAATSSNGTVNVSTTNGTLTVGTGQGVDGTALTGINAKGDINLTANTSTGSALDIQSAVVSQGNVTLTGTTSDTNNNSDAAIMSSALVKGNNITMTATATGTTGKTLGYRGKGDGGQFVATGDLTLTGTSKNDGNGFYMWGGNLSAGKALSITGKSTNGQGIGFEKAGTTASNVVITSGNGVTMTGYAKEGQEAIGFNDVTLTNTTGAVKLEALNQGNIVANSTNTLTQNGNGDVTLTTVGNGNITVPKIINNGTGKVEVAAGSDLRPGNGLGGQVKTLNGNSIKQNNGGKTYIYSGAIKDTGTLSNLDTSLAELYLDNSTTGKTQNADSGVGYGTTINGGANTQVLFREKINVNIQQNLQGATLDKQYGNASTANGQSSALWSEVQSALKTSNSNNGVSNQLTGTMQDAAGKDITFHVSAATVIQDMTGTMQGAQYNSTNTFLNANTSGYVYDVPAITGKYTTKFDPSNNTVKVTVAKAKVNVSGIKASDKEYDGTKVAALDATQANFAGKVGNDDLKVVLQDSVTTGTTGTFNDKNVGNGKTVTLSNITYGGADKGNYEFNDQTSTTANITRNTSAQVKLTALSGNKTYDGTTQSLQGLASATGLKGDDTVSNIGVTAITSGKNAGSYTNTQFGNLTDLEKNYANVEKINGSLTIDQNTTAKVVLTANSGTKTYTGASQSITGLVATGLLGDDKLDNGGAKASTSGTIVGTYTGTVFENLATLKKNYANVTTQNGTLTINAQPPKPPTPGPVSPVTPVKPVTPANPFQLASADDLTDEVCSPTSLENCYCEESSLNQGVDICYEPKTSGKGTAR